MANFTVADYLVHRLAQIGNKHIFGVAGDYNMEFIDSIVNCDRIELISTCNELNASYAADGYGRINGIAALITTFGVGELRAINGVAGAYAEKDCSQKPTHNSSAYIMVLRIVGFQTTC